MVILAKSSGETLSEHTIDCIRAAESIINSLPLSDEIKIKLEKDAVTSIALHDTGKAATGFQKMLKKEKKSWDGKRHEILSASLASNVGGISCASIFAILTHHKDIPSGITDESFGSLPLEQIPTVFHNTPFWKEMANEWEKNKPSFIEEWEKIKKYVKDTHSLALDIIELKLNNLSIDEAWIERNGKHSQEQMPFDDRYYFSLLRGIVIASDHLSSGHNQPKNFPEFQDFSVPISPRSFQEKMKTIDGSAILRAPTGSGKTEAALFWFQKNQRRFGRLFYVLPYTASINAMYGRMKKIFGEENVGILHHRASEALYFMQSSDEQTSMLDKQKNARELKDLAREIWFPIRVCTPHQIIRYVLRGRGWENMLSEFQNACFIFDEIHAYDPRIVGLILGSAKLLKKWDVRFLFLSATFPSFLKKLITDTIGDTLFLEPDPLLQSDAEILGKKRHTIHICDGNMGNHIKSIINSIREKSSTLIVCNHVKTSQDIFNSIKKALPEENVVLLHSQFNQEDRNRIEAEITKLPHPKVLVATQVVEVSLDIDFEQGYFEPAPIDALIQRMGRVNRSGFRNPADIIVFAEQTSKFNLYCKCIGKEHKPDCRIYNTVKALRGIKNPVSESDLVEIADIIYGLGYSGEDKIKFEEGLNHPDLTEFEKRMIAGTHRDWIDDIIEKTDGVIEVLPRSLKKRYEENIEKGLWINANSLLVPIRLKKLFAIKGLINKSGDILTVDLPYSPSEGLKMTNGKTNFSENFI